MASQRLLGRRVLPVHITVRHAPQRRVWVAWLLREPLSIAAAALPLAGLEERWILIRSRGIYWLLGRIISARGWVVGCEGGATRQGHGGLHMLCCSIRDRMWEGWAPSAGRVGELLHRASLRELRGHAASTLAGRSSRILRARRETHGLVAILGVAVVAAASATLLESTSGRCRTVVVTHVVMDRVCRVPAWVGRRGSHLNRVL